MDNRQSQEEFVGGEPTREPLCELRGALVWEADAWAIHFFLLSDASASLLGVDPREVEADAGFLKKHVHPEDWSALLEAMYEAAAEGGVHTSRHRMIRGDGSVIWAQTSVHRCARSNGTARLMGVTVDVTELVTREHEVREAEERARSLIQTLRAYGMFMVTPEGRVASWNLGAQQLEGYAANEVMGHYMARFFPPDEVAKGTPERLLKRAELEREAEYEGWLVRKGGSRFWASLVLSAVVDAQGVLEGILHVARDFTQRRQIDLALRHSEAQFRLLVESVQDYAVFTVSLEGRVETWNRGAQRLHGHRSQEIIGSSIERFFPTTEITNGTHERLIRDAELKGSATYEGLLTRKNGEPFWAMMTLSAVEDENGVLRGFSHVARDLTERKHAEDALRDGEQQLRLLIESLQDYAVFMLSPGGEVASWSSGAERLKGYKAEEALGMPLSRFFPPEEVEKGTPDELVRRAIHEGRAEYEGWIKHKQGPNVWASVILCAVKDPEGRLRGLSNVARDLTHRMLAEKAQRFLAEVGTVLASSLDQATICDAVCRLAVRDLARFSILVIRTDGAAEPIAVAHVDVEKEALLRTALLSVPVAHGVGHDNGMLESGRARIGVTAEEITAIAQALGIVDPRLVHELAMHSCICVPLMSRARVFGMIVLGACPEHEYSSYDLWLAEELARRASLAVENARLYEAAHAAIETREEVLAVVTHDLRSPLSTILMGATQLANRQHEGDVEGAVKIAERIKRASARMTTLIQDLLDFSSIEARRLRLELGTQSADALVLEAAEAFSPIAQAKGVVLRGEPMAAGASVRCDRSRIIQVFSTLVDNAVKFTDEGGEITVACRREGERVVFRCSDTGVGIDEEDLPRIFDRYWQAKRRAQGSVALGLAIAKGIVESQGGTIWVESTLGAGATFLFSLPIANGD